VINLLLALINIGSTAALNAVTSLVVAGLFISYIITMGLMLNRRLRPNVEASQLRWGPWKMGRWSGAVVNAFAIFYVGVATIFSFFPPTPEVTAESMNYSVVVFMGVICFGIVRYFVGGRKSFTGPVIETEDSLAQGKVEQLE
jgi:choline transport protein